MKLINKLLAFASCFFAISLSSCSPSKSRIQILMTSDLHGMLIPFNYATFEDTSKSGSLSQIGTAIETLRDDNTLVIDCGDAIQGNYANLFTQGEYRNSTHPMIEALNKLKYDVFVTGNHEYNFGMDYLQNQISKFNGTVLTGNVIKKTTYEPLANSYKIFNKNGIRVAVIGMTTPMIKTWDEPNLREWNVLDPIAETKKAVKDIKDNNLADVIVAAEHLGFPKEGEGTSVVDLANVCPDIDVILASHEHKLYENKIINGVLVCENKANAASLLKIDIELEKSFAIRPKVISKTSKLIKPSDYKTNKAIDEFSKPYDAAARKDANIVIGNLLGDEWMSPQYEIHEVPSTYIKPTPLVNIVNQLQLDIANEYTTKSEVKRQVKVSSTAMGNYEANLKPGEIKKRDCSNIYKYENTLYILKMNGAQLKRYMEWTAKFYQKAVEKDLTIAFVDNTVLPLFNYDMFSGVFYDIDITKDVGKRIKVYWDKEKQTEVGDDETFYMACNNYRANTNLLKIEEGNVFDKPTDKLPTLVDIDVGGQGIRELLVQYITDICDKSGKKGFYASEFENNNWDIIHNNWDETKRQLAVDGINNGTYKIGNRNTIKITEDDIKS